MGRESGVFGKYIGKICRGLRLPAPLAQVAHHGIRDHRVILHQKNAVHSLSSLFRFIVAQRR